MPAASEQKASIEDCEEAGEECEDEEKHTDDEEVDVGKDIESEDDGKGTYKDCSSQIWGPVKAVKVSTGF